MGALLDSLPLLLFFGAFKLAELHADAVARFATEHLGFAVQGGVVGATEAPALAATLVVFIATLVQIAVLLAMRRRVHTMLWVTFATVTLLGGASVWLHDPIFIKWKPTIVYWASAIGLWASQALFGKNALKSTLGEQVTLPMPVWQRLNVAWIAFFVVLGFVNLYVAYNYSFSSWATFKVFGGYGLILVFVFAQMPYISRHLPVEDDPRAKDPVVPSGTTVAGRNGP